MKIKCVKRGKGSHANSDTIGAIENIMIKIGDKTLLEFFVKYEKNGYRPFLMPKSAKNSHFSV